MKVVYTYVNSQLKCLNANILEYYKFVLTYVIITTCTIKPNIHDHCPHLYIIAVRIFVLRILHNSKCVLTYVCIYIITYL